MVAAGRAIHKHMWLALHTTPIHKRDPLSHKEYLFSYSSSLLVFIDYKIPDTSVDTVYYENVRDPFLKYD